MLAFERVKEAVISYSMHSLSVRQMLNSSTTWNRIIPQDRKDLVTTVLKADSQLKWKTRRREEARFLEQWGRAWGHDISQDQPLGEGQYADLQRKSIFDDNILDLCCIAALNA